MRWRWALEVLVERVFLGTGGIVGELSTAVLVHVTVPVAEGASTWFRRSDSHRLDYRFRSEHVLQRAGIQAALVARPKLKVDPCLQFRY